MSISGCVRTFGSDSSESCLVRPRAHYSDRRRAPATPLGGWELGREVSVQDAEPIIA